jgi:hypothetical protein
MDSLFVLPLISLIRCAETGDCDMVQARRSTLSIEQVERETNELLKKNQELMDKWREQYKQDRDELRAQKRRSSERSGTTNFG